MHSSQYHQQLAIFLTRIDRKLWRQFPHTVEDIPVMCVVFWNRTMQRIPTERNSRGKIYHRQIFNQAIRSSRQTTRTTAGFGDHIWEEISLSK